MSWRPWSAQARRLRSLRGCKRRFPEPIRRWNVFQGDLVEVLTGRDKGKQAKVVSVVRHLNRVYVKGLNTHIRVLPPQEQSESPVRISAEAPLHISNVALVDPEDSKPCRVKYQYTEEGEKVRVSRRSGRIIPMPIEILEKKKINEHAAQGSKDTMSEDVLLRTYTPNLMTFEEEISKIMEEYKAATHPKNKVETASTGSELS